MDIDKNLSRLAVILLGGFFALSCNISIVNLHATNCKLYVYLLTKMRFSSIIYMYNLNADFPQH